MQENNNKNKSKSKTKYSFTSKHNTHKEEKDIINQKNIKELKTEFQEPKEEIMKLLSPNKSNKKYLEEDIYKTEMNNKKPVEIFQDPSIENIDISKKDEIKEEKNDNLQYLIDKNKIEKIDFITTLLKLKGIKIDDEINNITNKENIPLSYDNKYIKNNNNNYRVPSNTSTTISKITNENKLTNGDSLYENNNLTTNFTIINNKNDIVNNNFINYNKICKTLNAINNENNNINNKNKTINNPKKLMRFCSSMIKNRKKPKIYNSFNTSKKINNRSIKYNEKKIYHYIFNNIRIKNSNIIYNNTKDNISYKINNKNKINEYKNSNIKKCCSLCHNCKTNLIKKIPRNYKNISLLQNYNKNRVNRTSSKSPFKERKNNFNIPIHNHNSSIYKNRSQSIIRFNQKINKNKKNLCDKSNNKTIDKERKNNFKFYSISKDIYNGDSNGKNIKKNIINIFKKKNVRKNFINLKQKNKKIKDKLYKIEKEKNGKELFSSKSNLINFGNENEGQDTFRINIKELKKKFNEKGNDSNFNNFTKIIDQKINELIINKNKIKKNKDIQKSNNCNLKIYDNKKIMLY